MEQICKLKDVYKALYSFDRDFSDKNGITINEGMILCCLKDNLPHSALDICNFVGLSTSRVSRVINTVENKGFIRREMGSTDKRQMFFSLTDDGQEKVNSLRDHSLDLSELKHLFSQI